MTTLIWAISLLAFGFILGILVALRIAIIPTWNSNTED